MSTENNPRLSKTLGALLGVHAGDSLGATLEFMSYAKIKSKYPTGLREIIGGGMFNWTAGHATDDTDLTRAVLLAYRDRSASSSASFDLATSAAEWSLKWLNGDWPGRKKGIGPVDIGGATRTGLMQFEKSRNARKCGAGQGSAGNGSLMRCIPTALFTRSKEERIKESMEISAFTHNDARCTVACAVYNEIVAALVEGKAPGEAIEVGLGVAGGLDCPAVEDCIKRGKGWSISKFATNGPGGELPEWSSGYVLQSFSIAIAALLDNRSFEDVLVDVIRLGGDTDTNGAIAGGLLGARDGIEAIPERWLRVLQFRDEFEELARGLLHAQAVSA
ncbi:ADP-ribosylglycohydrolase [Lentithecium fluviatile CBS 122367]|uniref:ADP-ribosylhydrolase ARH3 n=1 Tax=Lentithecium fluviatile CBS 122367 TaxID=1168545 RepID=A0A6G1IND3_9PLEO|nr:ADP-ribosylglycohydrolase [Lentithecium fluviatile CBS 122367]